MISVPLEVNQTLAREARTLALADYRDRDAAHAKARRAARPCHLIPPSIVYINFGRGARARASLRRPFGRAWGDQSRVRKEKSFPVGLKAGTSRILFHSTQTIPERVLRTEKTCCRHMLSGAQLTTVGCSLKIILILNNSHCKISVILQNDLYAT